MGVTQASYPFSRTSQIRWALCSDRWRITWEQRDSFNPHAVVGIVVQGSENSFPRKVKVKRRAWSLNWFSQKHTLLSF